MDWIERILHFDPDAHSGVLELALLMALAFAVVYVAARVMHGGVGALRVSGRPAEQVVPRGDE